MPKPVIVDSSALVALLKLDDADHKKAVHFMDDVLPDSNISLLLPLEVLAESLNILGKKIGKQKAIAAGKLIVERISIGEMQLVKSGLRTIVSALRSQATASGNPSFIDCLVMAHAGEQQTEFVFGFDAAFGKNGFKLPE